VAAIDGYILILFCLYEISQYSSIENNQNIYVRDPCCGQHSHHCCCSMGQLDLQLIQSLICSIIQYDTKEEFNVDS